MGRDYGTTNAAPYASAPAVGSAGDTYYNTTGKILYLSDGTVWTAAGSAAANGVPAGGAAGQVLNKVSATDYDDAWTGDPGSAGGITSVTASGNNALGIYNGQRINGAAAMGPLQHALSLRGLGWDGTSAYRVLGNITIGTDAAAVSPTNAGGTFQMSTTQNGTITNTPRVRIEGTGMVEIGNKVKIGQALATAGLAGSCLDLSNGLLNMRRQAITLANGANNDLTLPTSSFVEFTGPTGAFSLSGIAGGIDGAIINFLYLGTQPFTLTHQATSAAANQIMVLSTSGLGTRDEATVGPCAGTLVYNANSTKWVLMDMQYGGYKPFSQLARMQTSTQVTGIGNAGQSIIGTTANIYIPGGNRLIEQFVHVTTSTLNSGAWVHGWLDGAWVSGRIGTVSAASSYWSMSGVCATQPAAGNHTFSVGLYAESGKTVNLEAALDMAWFEVWDRGVV